jgi:hypothetical protein
MMTAFNETWNTDDFPELEPPLEAGVRAVLAEPVPNDGVQRVKERALRLAAPARRSVDAVGQLRDPFRWRTLKWGALVAAVTVVVFVSMFPSSSKTLLALDEVVKAVRRQPWIHGTTTYSDGQQTRTSEIWVANERQFAAFKFENTVHFADLIQDITLKYDATEGNVYRVASSRNDLREGLLGKLLTPGFLDRLVDRSSAPSDTFYGERVITAERRDDMQDGKTSVQYVVHLQRIDNSNINHTLRIRVDGASGLPNLSEEQHTDGSRAVKVVTRFDYPMTGPGDIYALGVPKTAQVIDRVPRGDLARLLAAHRAARTRFEDYDVIVAQHTEGAPINHLLLLNLDVKRVRRKGNRYRIDALVLAQPGLAAPAEGADMRQWWKDHRDGYWSVPLQVCDGKQVYFYRMVDDRITSLDKMPNLNVVLASRRPIRLPADDSPVEWPHLMPEFCSRPHLWTTDETRKFDVDMNGPDGPDETLRIIVTKTSGKRAGELSRFWFDPVRDYVLRKETSPVFQPNVDEVAYAETVEYEELAQSPSGQWFPQRVRRTTSDNPNLHSVRRFYVDFETSLDDELFELLPVK